jgi:hypothetical protein
MRWNLPKLKHEVNHLQFTATRKRQQPADPAYSHTTNIVFNPSNIERFANCRCSANMVCRIKIVVGPNKLDALNPAGALPFQIEHHWCRVDDPCR